LSKGKYRQYRRLRKSGGISRSYRNNIDANIDALSTPYRRQYGRKAKNVLIINAYERNLEFRSRQASVLVGIFGLNFWRTLLKSNLGGKKGRSGPPGNLNSVKRPWAVFWRRRALQPKNTWLWPLVEEYGRELARGCGGDRKISAAARALVENAQVSRACIMLILLEAKEKGAIRQLEDGSWDLQPGMRDLPKFLAAERGPLIALDQKPKKLPPLAELFQQLDRDSEPEEATPPITRPGPEEPRYNVVVPRNLPDVPDDDPPDDDDDE
jgi:hypothetical protein